MAKFCGDCGSALSASAKFCVGCGKSLTPVKPKCPTCGQDMPETDATTNPQGVTLNTQFVDQVLIDPVQAASVPIEAHDKAGFIHGEEFNASIDCANCGFKATEAPCEHCGTDQIR